MRSRTIRSTAPSGADLIRICCPQSFPEAPPERYAMIGRLCPSKRVGTLPEPPNGAVPGPRHVLDNDCELTHSVA